MSSSFLGRPPRRRRTFARRTSERIVTAIRPLFLSSNNPDFSHELLEDPLNGAHNPISPFSSGISMHEGTRAEDRVIEYKFSFRRDLYMYGVVDGHGGRDCANFVADELPRAVETRARNVSCEDDNLLGEAWGDVLEGAFSEISQKWDKLGVRCSGAVASLVIVSGTSCLIAHAGDCKIVASVDEDSYVELTRDHRCSDPEEVERVEDAGGVVLNGRVEGKLLPSRAFGDIDVRTVAHGMVLDCIAPEPDISYYNFDNSKHSFMILASDGLFDVIPTSKAVAQVRRCLLETKDASAAAKLLTDAAAKRSADDVSVVVLYFRKQYYEGLNL